MDIMSFKQSVLSTKAVLLLSGLLFFSNGLYTHSQSDRPNIVWLVSEDNSKHYLKLCDEGGGAMPNIEGLDENASFSIAVIFGITERAVSSI